MIIHLVREGEKLSSIAARYGTSTDAIVDKNQHRPSVQLLSGARVFASLSAGDELVMPPVAGMADPAAVYCGELGGEMSLGDDGVCTLPNGTRCKHWTLFRGECPGYPAKYPDPAKPNKPGGWTPAVPETQPEPMISKPMIAGGLAVLGLALGVGALVFWPKK
jgi:hypothetical protein